MDNSLLTPMERLANAFEAMAGINNGSSEGGSSGGEKSVVYMLTPKSDGSDDEETRQIQVAVKASDSDTGAYYWMVIGNTPLSNILDEETLSEDQLEATLANLVSHDGYYAYTWSEMSAILDDILSGPGTGTGK